MNLKAVIGKNTNMVIAIVKNLRIKKRYIVGSKFYTRELNEAPKMLISQSDVVIKDFEIYEIGKDNIDKLRQIAMMGIYSNMLIYIKYTKETIKNITDEEKSIIKLIENKVVNHNAIKEIFGYYPPNLINKRRLIQFEDADTTFNKDEMFIFKEL
jgi:hypothetical protein